MEFISWFEYRIIVSAILSGFISVISVYFGRILVGDVFVNFNYIFDFRFVFFFVVVYSVRTRVFFYVFIFIASEQKSRFRLIKRRKILIFNYLRIWSVRVLFNLIIIIIRCGSIFIVLNIFFIQLHILIIIRFTDRFPSDVIKGSPTNINLNSDITFAFHLLDEFIFSNILIGFRNM
jgi:hypothetical protein